MNITEDGVDKSDEGAVYFDESTCTNGICELVSFDFKKISKTVTFRILTTMVGVESLEKKVFS